MALPPPFPRWTYGASYPQEPHPADDLNGADVARKLTILSRFIPALRSALPQGYQSVDTKSLVPSELEDIDSGDKFIKRLPQFDAHYDAMRAEAAKAGQVLRYAGVVDVQSGVIKADLERYILIFMQHLSPPRPHNDSTPVQVPGHAPVRDGVGWLR